jgi:hypothetical protein
MIEVTHCRTITEGMIGNDVIAVKRALSRWNPKVYPWQKFTPVAGPFLMNVVVEYKRRHKLGNLTRAIGPTMYESLERARTPKNEPAFDKFAIQLIKDFCESFTKTPEQRIREAIVNAGFFWYHHRSEISYSQARPFQKKKPPSIPSRWDCSAFVTNCHYAGGAPDPNGRGYDGLGYTGTLKNQGVRVGSVNDLMPGDLVFYGFSSGKPGFNPGDPTHVALYVGKFNGIPSVLSLGSYPMGFYRYNYRSINQRRHYKVT